MQHDSSQVKISGFDDGVDVLPVVFILGVFTSY